MHTTFVIIKYQTDTIGKEAFAQYSVFPVILLGVTSVSET